MVYTIQFSTMNWFDRSDIVIHLMILIRFNIIERGNSSIEFTDERLIISMGLNPELLWSKKHWDYGSKYSCIYCYCTVHSNSYCFSTYHLCKNSQSKWLKIPSLLINLNETRLLSSYQWLKKENEKNFNFTEWADSNRQYSMRSDSMVERKNDSYISFYHTTIKWKCILDNKSLISITLQYYLAI